MRTEYIVKWAPPDDLLAMLQLHDPDLRPFEHQYADKHEAQQHASRAIITLSLLFRRVGLDLALVKLENTEVEYGA